MNIQKFISVKTIKFSIVALATAMILSNCNKSNPTFPEQENVSSVINTNDYHKKIDNETKSLQKAIGQIYKWHYMNILRSNQNGELRWYLENNCNDGFDVRTVIRAAYAKWQPYVPFRFVEVTSAAQANTVIRFVDSDTYIDHNGSSQSFFTRNPNGTVGVLFGLGYAPYENYRGLGFDFWGDIIINDRARWAQGNVATTQVVTPDGIYTHNINLLYVLTHEIGHTLGLDHDNSSTNNLMHENAGFTVNARLWDADIQLLLCYIKCLTKVLLVMSMSQGLLQKFIINSMVEILIKVV